MSERDRPASSSGAPPPDACARDLLHDLLPVRTPPPAPGLLRLDYLLSGNGFDELPALDSDRDEPGLDAFDPRQREAIAAALRTPDLCLIEGLPGTGKSHVAAEIMARTLAQGGRVLLLAPASAALDRAIESLSKQSEISAMRCLVPGESEAGLPETARQCVFAERQRRLCTLAAERAAAARELMESGARAVAESQAAVQRARAEASTHETAIAELRPFAQALAAGRWWTPRYWKARGMENPVARLAELEAKHQAALNAVTQSHTEADRQTAEIADAQALAESLDATLAAIPDRLADSATLVAATPAALAADSVFGDSRQRFDLLVVEEAHEIGEPDLIAAAGRANRWVLLGEPSQVVSPRANGHQPPDSPFQKLWRRLSVEPWGIENGRIVARLRPVAPQDRARLTVEPVVDRPDIELRILEERDGMPQLAEVAFPPGTTAAQARSYLIEQLGESPIAGRAVRLETPHRMAPALAGVVADLLGRGSYDPGTNGAHGPVVEFIAVPPLAGAFNGHAGSARLPADVRGGAGLEIDLADPRQRGHLPPDLRDVLPSSGLVNLLEARTIVPLIGSLSSSSSVGVLAMTAAQAELIRVLAAASPCLPSGLIIDVPPFLRQREVGTLIVSLVRSHTHRAVSYGDEPGWLPLALSRGRTRLIFVGDPGTLARRAQWDGSLDRLDAANARRERELVQHLVGYLQGRGQHPRAFRLQANALP